METTQGGRGCHRGVRRRVIMTDEKKGGRREKHKEGAIGAGMTETGGKGEARKQRRRVGTMRSTVHV